MGEAKRRRAIPMVYHHTSTLRTNLIWMSGVIEVEGKTEDVIHPQLGKIMTNVLSRREMKDFPPVAWFTTQLTIPRCLIVDRFQLAHEDTGEIIGEVMLTETEANMLALQRVALGFPIANIDVIPWPEHVGFDTDEGRRLNKSAIDAGDDPADWYVSDRPVDVLKATGVWTSNSIATPKLERRDWYLKDVKKMVSLCRDNPRAYIPPSYLTQKQAESLAKVMGRPLGSLD